MNVAWERVWKWGLGEGLGMRLGRWAEYGDEAWILGWNGAVKGMDMDMWLGRRRWE